MPQSQSNSLFLVSGFTRERGFFLGHSSPDPEQAELAHVTELEGKWIETGFSGAPRIQPLLTRVRLASGDPSLLVQAIDHPSALAEAERLLGTSVQTLNPVLFPILYRFVQVTKAPAPASTAMEQGRQANSLSEFQATFQRTAEQFRHALIQELQVQTTRELDKLTELEGDLVIELGKVSNEIAAGFNQLSQREDALAAHMALAVDPEQDFEFGDSDRTRPGSSWLALLGRLEYAKNWARREGRTPLVRELNANLRQASTRLGEVVLEHCSALDTLISESFTQHDLGSELRTDVAEGQDLLIPAEAEPSTREALSDSATPWS